MSVWVVNLIKLMRLSLFNNEDEPEVSMSALDRLCVSAIDLLSCLYNDEGEKQGYFSGSADFGISHKTETG